MFAFEICSDLIFVLIWSFLKFQKSFDFEKVQILILCRFEKVMTSAKEEKEVCFSVGPSHEAKVA